MLANIRAGQIIFWALPYVIIWLPVVAVAGLPLVGNSCGEACALYDGFVAYMAIAAALALSFLVAAGQLVITSMHGRRHVAHA